MALGTLALSLGSTLAGDFLGNLWDSDKYDESAAWKAGSALYDQYKGDLPSLNSGAAWSKAGRLGAPAIRRGFQLAQQNYQGPSASAIMANQRLLGDADTGKRTALSQFNTARTMGQQATSRALNDNMISRGLSPTQRLALSRNLNLNSAGLDTLTKGQDAFARALQIAAGNYATGEQLLDTSEKTRFATKIEPEMMNINQALTTMPAQGFNAGSSVGQNLVMKPKYGGLSSMLGNIGGMGGTLSSLRMYEDLFGDSDPQNTGDSGRQNNFPSLG